MEARSSPQPPESDLDATQAALLGLLALRDWSTYELAQQMKRSLRWFWNRAERKLYQDPKRLVAAGLATSRVEHTGRRATTIYSITASGRVALRNWLDRHGDAPVFEIEDLIRVFFADQGSIEQLRATIEHMGRSSRKSRDELVAVADSMDLDEPMVADRLAVNALSIDLVLGLYESVIDWAAWADKVTASWSDTVTPDWDGVREFKAGP